MINDNYSEIYNEMGKIVIHNFQQENLLQDIQSFIDYKITESLKFGELTILHYTMFGGKSKDIFKVAAAVELLILALDIFDDLQDQDNKEVPWNKIGYSESMNIATGLLIASQQAVEQTSFDEKNKSYARNHFQLLVIEAVNGQHIDLLNLIETEEDYIEGVLQKSGSLVALACLVGTSLATIDKNTLKLVSIYGKQMGLVAQITNDSKDVQRMDQKNDLIYKKKTLPILFLLRGFTEGTQKIKEYYSSKSNELQLNDDLKQVIQFSGAIQYANVISNIYQEKITKLVNNLEVNSIYKDELLEYIY